MNEYIYASSGEPLANSDGEVSLARTEIVRCRDCKFSEVVTDCYSDKPFLGCNAEWCEGSEGDHPCVKPDGFCAWGERKGE